MMPDPCIKQEGDDLVVIDLNTGRPVPEAVTAHTGLLASRDFYTIQRLGLFGRIVEERVYGDFRITRPDPNPFPTSRIRLGRTGIDWPTGGPIPKAAQHAVRNHHLLGVAVVVTVILLIVMPFATAFGWWA